MKYTILTVNMMKIGTYKYNNDDFTAIQRPKYSIEVEIPSNLCKNSYFVRSMCPFQHLVVDHSGTV